MNKKVEQETKPSKFYAVLTTVGYFDVYANVDDADAAAKWWIRDPDVTLPVRIFRMSQECAYMLFGIYDARVGLVSEFEMNVNKTWIHEWVEE